MIMKNERLCKKRKKNKEAVRLHSIEQLVDADPSVQVLLGNAGVEAAVNSADPT